MKALSRIFLFGLLVWSSAFPEAYSQSTDIRSDESPVPDFHIVKEGRGWISVIEETYRYPQMSDNPTYEYIGEKTLIDGKEYNLITIYDLSSGTSSYRYYREENDKVYSFDPGTQEETLMFDFSLNTDGPDALGFEVKKTDKVTDKKGHIYNRYLLTRKNTNCIAVDGIGMSLRHIPEPLNSYENYLPTYFEDNEVIFSRDDFFHGTEWEPGDEQIQFVKPGKTWWYRLSEKAPVFDDSTGKIYMGLAIAEQADNNADGWYPLMVIKDRNEGFKTPLGYLKEADGKVYYRDNSKVFIKTEMESVPADRFTKYVGDNIRSYTSYHPGNEGIGNGTYHIYDFSASSGEKTSLGGIENSVCYDRISYQSTGDGAPGYGRRYYCPQPDNFTTFIMPAQLLIDGIGIVRHPGNVKGVNYANSYLAHGFFFNPFPAIAPNLIINQDYPEQPWFVTLTDGDNIIWDTMGREGPWLSDIDSITSNERPNLIVSSSHIRPTGFEGDVSISIYSLTGIHLFTLSVNNGYAVAIPEHSGAGALIAIASDNYGHTASVKFIN